MMTTTTENPTSEDARLAARRAKQRERSRKWREAHREELRKRNRKYHEANAEKRREEQRRRARAYCAAHPDKVSERNRKYYAAHQEKMRERQRTYNASEHGRLRNAEYREYIRGPRVDDLRARCEYVMNEVFHSDAQRRRFAHALLNRGFRHPVVRSLLFHLSFDMEYIAPYIEEAA